MYKKLTALLSCLLMTVVFSGCGAQEKAHERVIVTSFYPMYVFAQNITKGVPNVSVVNMADQNVGCLHDYQLQTRDMVTLEKADALIINGGGMEQFLEKVAKSYPQLPVIDASMGIDMLESAHGGHDHDHDEPHEEACVLNAHVWLNPVHARKQVMNICGGLCAVDPQNAKAYQENAQAYCEKLTAMEMEIGDLLTPYQGSKIIVFHEAFIYFAQAFGLEVAGLIEHDAGEEPGTRDLAKTCDLVRKLGLSALFVEPQYPQKAANTIARETGAKVYLLDPVVSGDGGVDSYERAMRTNAQMFTEAFEP